MKGNGAVLAAICAVLFVSDGFSQTPAAVISDRAAARFLDQATWGPTPASVLELRLMGMNTWLKWQFALNSSDLPDQPLLNDAGNANTDLRPVQRVFFNNGLGGVDQLRQRVAFALSKIWVVSQLELTNAYAFPPYWRIFRHSAFGNYRDVIRAVTLNPAMGRYLNMANNNKGNPARGIAANENYARELLQLFTVGLTQLNQDGTPVLDQSGNPVPTYDQAAIANLSRALTGWTYPTAPGATPRSNNPAYYLGQMTAVAANHDTTQKKIFDGIVIPPGQTAEQDLDSVLDALMAHPTMAPFVCRQLIQHLVTSNPSPAYVQRVSDVFRDNGGGASGDMKAVVTAILMDPEARAGDDEGVSPSRDFGRLREPVLLVLNLLRGLNGALGPDHTLYDQTSRLGQDLFRAPSVFGYFSPQYRLAGGLVGPEFQIHSTQTATYRSDLVTTLLYGSIKGTTVDLSPFLAHAADTGALLDSIDAVFLHHAMSEDLRQAARGAAEAATTPLRKVQAALYVVLTSGEYQIVH